ncbi:putative protein OS=Tsukamurella paurometabola (strain ATCC 8368 / DSM / CCUG 35730 /CIP 100753 / JCM 10117 / KCTC 9821 / NBRC 16120 / NCIMB 702349/ NCTC 13040) OX=521096 GN=Tpau_0411 PE=4 SV=1 [Tsukamurella paurometabola]|uniref:Uncharacterized protein n=1 Tax=Tsukamurella paurometabola (strain ATCC 8368 / DSM 20162 / CCUG 35730 / CIP 100753 / JCM 10117 / KCTC 9821 / NBRC 16120 / NCIMB 702349 / NCTC 13040) TaxID=521096 RepID=D5URJ9_TSUPD|nr:hypothetical protein [Tsukamurella paurometabola]ADG77052.1 hypothetical protein Tpau_0411 [Tsukamurella paurometabola DSM 20162]SUP42608.1 Uncharacterised protein [Tsukamurella paurometabola]
MSRPKLGAPFSRWWYAWFAVVAVMMVSSVQDRRWATAVLWLAILAAATSEIARSLRQRNLAFGIAGILGVVAALLGYAERDWLAVGLGAMIAVVLVAFLPKIRHDVPTCRVRTEELVGRTVADATHLLGFDDRRQPAGLSGPELVPMPPGEQDLGDPELIVTAVTVVVDAGTQAQIDAATITFGVADSDDPAIPAAGSATSLALTKSEAQDRLVGIVGGGPADIRPRRFPGS